MTAISGGLSHSVALKDGVPYAWGNPHDDRTFVPTELRRGGVTAVAAGNVMSMAVKNGKVWAWGDYALPGTRLAPPPETASGVKTVAAGYLRDVKAPPLRGSVPAGSRSEWRR